LALLLILAGTLVSVTVASLLGAREDLVTALGSWRGTAATTAGAKMQGAPRGDAGSQGTATAGRTTLDFGFVEAFRLPGRNPPPGPAAGARTDAAAVSAPEARQPDTALEPAVTAAMGGGATESDQAAPAGTLVQPSAPPAEPAAPAVEDAEPACPQPIAVGFARNSLLPAGVDLRAEAAALSSWLSRFPTASLVIEGHTDSLGPDDVNRAVSEQRALAIADLLIGAGLAADRITVLGLGESQPLPAFRPQAAQQRRVVLRLDRIPGCPAEPGEPGALGEPVEPAP
jgi:outer membrane protein OmpA-like peptidoglycan-associated protein